jgi:surfactin synthase thioesterase subunit
VSPAEARAWKELTTGELDIHWVTGGHFFVEHNREWVLEKVNALVTACIR